MTDQIIISEESHRFLAKLIGVPSPDGRDNGGDDDADDSNSLATSIISYMHNAPRFGHSNRVGIIASTNHEDSMEYASGLKQFTLFTLIPFILWALLLVALKYLYGPQKVGCAAGGQVVDIRRLSKRGISRKTRRTYIVRNWRVQASFLVVCLMIPTLTLILVKVGWGQMDAALHDIKDTMDDIESWSYNGYNIVERLKRTESDIRQHQFVRQTIELSSDNNKKKKSHTVFDEWCPNPQQNSSLAFLKDSFVQVQSFASRLEKDYDRYVPTGIVGFQTISDIAHDIDSSIQRIMDNDWMIKFFLMVLNVINLLMVLICQICSRNNIIHPPTRAFTSWLLLPIFFALTVTLIAITAVGGIVTLFNADFCSGGDNGTPEGTFRDAILSFVHGSPDASMGPDDSMEIVYDSFQYYSGGCLNDHPLDFLQDFSIRIGRGVSQLTQLNNALVDAQNETFLIDTLSAECGADVSFLPATMSSLDGLFLDLQEQMDAYVNLISCSRVSPIIRRVTNGSICNESVKGVMSLWACSFSLLVCCFLMWSLRAALFNSIKRGRKRDKKPKRVVEKEFEEYKEFMKEYYGDDEVGKWKVQGIKHQQTTTKSKVNQVEFDLGSQLFIEPKNTFDTEGSSPSSAQAGVFSFEQAEDNEEGTEIAPVMEDPTANGEDGGGGTEEEDEDASSYESCSDEESAADADAGADDDKSALLSFFVETKEMARHGIRNVRDFGSTVSDNVSAIGSSVMDHRSSSADDASAFSSLSSKASSFASSVAHKTLERVKGLKLKPLLGGGNGEEDNDPDDSIDDESLFLSPAEESNAKRSEVPGVGSSALGGHGGRGAINDSFEQELEEVFEQQGRHESSRRSTREWNKERTSVASNSTTRSTTQSTRQGSFDRIWKIITPVVPPGALEQDDTTPRDSSSTRRVKTPTAPKKAVQFLSRTRKEYDDEEIQPLSPNRTSVGSSSMIGNDVQPTRLRLSPYHRASGGNNDSNSRQRKRGIRRPRVSLYYDDEASDSPGGQWQVSPVSPPKSNRFSTDSGGGPRRGY